MSCIGGPLISWPPNLVVNNLFDRQEIMISLHRLLKSQMKVLVDVNQSFITIYF